MDSFIHLLEFYDVLKNLSINIYKAFFKKNDDIKHCIEYFNPPTENLSPIQYQIYYKTTSKMCKKIDLFAKIT